MAALTEDKVTVNQSDGKLQEQEVAASTTIYKNAMVCWNATGYLVPASDAAALEFAGKAIEGVDNSTGVDGAKKVRVEMAEIVYDIGTAVSMVSGTPAYASDDQTVTTSALATNNVRVGTISKRTSATAGRLKQASNSNI